MAVRNWRPINLVTIPFATPQGLVSELVVLSQIGDKVDFGKLNEVISDPVLRLGRAVYDDSHNSEFQERIQSSGFRLAHFSLPREIEETRDYLRRSFHKR